MKRKFKRIISFFLVLTLMLSVFMGCQQADTNQEQDQQTTEETSTEKDLTEESNESDEKAELVKENIENYKYNEFIPFDENGKLKTEGREDTSEHGMVSTPKYEASKIGADIMSQGGNAVDAAVAASFAIGVCEPNASGLGGGGFMTMRTADGELHFIDFREIAPINATDDMYLDENGEVIEGKERGGPIIAVPGEVAGLLYILENYGTMTREEVLQPAIELAEEGFLVTPKFHQVILDDYDLMVEYPELGDLYLNEDNLPLEAGTIVKNPDLAKALRIIADKGVEGFYEGEIADAIVSSVEEAGGIITYEDLSTYEVKELEPVVGEYRGYEIISSPPPSSGGAHLIQILNILENYDLSEYEQYSAEYMHLFSEIFKMVYNDRAEYMGDPNYVDVPLDGIMSKVYAEHLASKIDMEEAQEYEADDPWQYENDTTTHLSVADSDGNMIGITKTINYYFGSGVVVDGYGFIMNNEMDDFSPETDEPNSVAPGKVPLSSMSPTLLLKDGNPYMVVGCPGGYTIFAQLAQVISHVIDYDMDIQEAIDMPRIFDSMSNELIYMDGIDEAEVEKLKEMGHEVTHMTDDTFGFVQGILYEDGVLKGGSDVYTDGKAVGFEIDEEIQEEELDKVAGF